MHTMTQETQTWLEEKFQTWRHGKRHPDDTIVAFARYLERPLATVNNWMLKGQTPGRAQLRWIAQKTGDWSIYDAAGVPRPPEGDERVTQFNQTFGKLAPEQQDEILRAMLEMLSSGETAIGGGNGHPG